MKTAPLYSAIAEAPPNGKAYWIQTDDEIRLRVALWPSEQASKGSIFIFPGRTEYIEVFGRTIRRLNDLGYTVLVIDWRGHGLSDRLIEDSKSVHVTCFIDYQKDVTAMVRAADELALPKPWFLLGNSMGGCIGLRAVLEEMPVAACAFTAPMWGVKMSRLQRISAWPLTWAAQTFGRGQSYCPGYDNQNYVLNNSFHGNRMTCDPDMYKYWVNQAKNKPDLQLGGPSMQWLFQSLNENRRLSKLASPDLPCIAFIGDQDKIVERAAIESRLKKWPKGNFEFINSAKHELLLEVPSVRENILSKITSLFREP